MSFSTARFHQCLRFRNIPSIRRRSASTTRCTTLDPSNSSTLTQQVDGLFERTRNIMTQHEGSDRMCQHTVAFSGGIDSSLVAQVVYQTSRDLGGSERHVVTAVLGISPAVSAEQVHSAEQVAAFIGVPLVQIPTYEGTREMYIANTGQACFACKSELYHSLIHHTIAKYHGSTVPDPSSAVDTRDPSSIQPSPQHHHLLYNGTNADDCTDPTRVGLIAAAQYNVFSPLDHLHKATVRQIARHLGLPNWNVAANPCLRSRLALGVPATREHLQRIERGERFVRQQLATATHIGVTVETNVRLRLLAAQRACLEIDAGHVPDVTNLYQTHQEEWDQVFLKELQFSSLTIRPFRSGSVAAATAASV